MHVALDNHDIISMKLYQLTVERTPEEEEEEQEDVTLPRVDDMEQFHGRCTMTLSTLVPLKSSVVSQTIG